MVQVFAYIIILGIIIAVLGAFLPTLAFNLGGWGQAVEIVNYAFLFIDPVVFVSCFAIIIILAQFDLLWGIAHWLVKVIKF